MVIVSDIPYKCVGSGISMILTKEMLNFELKADANLTILI